MAVRLWLVRHAQPQAVAGCCYGRSEVPVDDRATQAAALALAQALPSASRVLTSPRQRCADLADGLRELRPSLQVCTDARLAEMDFGDWEGRPWDAVGEPALAAWTSEFWTHRPGGGESVRAVFERVGRAFDEARASPGDVAWITHAGVIRTARLIAAGVRRVDDACAWPTEPVPYGRWTVLEF